ncbi:MAG TPA: hypothetical protein DIC56_16360 [Rhizobium sp.]|nr:hypothetical protein [Rhizobium sp.]
MFSDVHQQFLTSMNLRMLGSILDDAGIVDIDTSPDRERRMSFGRYLVDAFQTGVTGEAELAQGLAARIEALPAAGVRNDTNPSEQADIAEWENEGGRPGLPDDWEPYLFGRRIERDGTWTIYHVFSGTPAQYGTWDMEGLTGTVASRALRTVNLPQSAGEP